jgi:glucose/arabinose dehydrogenase
MAAVGTTQGFAQAATPTARPTEPITATERLTPTAEATPMAPVDILIPSIGFSQTAMISPTQVLTGIAVQPGVSLPVSVSIQLVKVAEGFIDPINVVSARDGSGRLFVVERHGVIRIVNADGQVVEEPFLDISEIVLSAFLEQGLYDVEFHPNFAENGRFFVHFAELLRNGDSLIVEYQVSGDEADVADPNTARVILQIEQPWANHNGGELAFGPDGYLYIGSGDGGWEGDPLNAGQDLTTLLGKVLRIDVDVADGRAYAIPPDNPFAQAATPRLVQLFGTTEREFARIRVHARPEIWAYGLRNPWKFQFDRETGALYLPDVGQNFWEEINFQPADSPGGENYGWNFLMGTFCFPIEAQRCNAVGVLPVAEYSHGEHGCTIIGMGIYRGAEFTDLNGIYFSGDYCSGKLWGLMRSEDGTWAFAQLLDTGLQFTGAGEDENGNLYVTSCHCNYGGDAAQANPPGEVWQIIPADQVPQGAETAPAQE